MIDALVAIDRSISLARTLHDSWKKIGDAEVKGFLATIQNELADAKLEIASLKERIVAQAEEIRTLKTVASNATQQRPSFKWAATSSRLTRACSASRATTPKARSTTPRG